MALKGDQPVRRRDLERLVADGGLVAATGTVAATVGKGHGRLERRRLWASAALVGDTEWPGPAQAPCGEREVVTLATGEIRRERASAVTSPPPEIAGAATPLRLWRGHRGIANRLHYVRDVVFGADRPAARAGGVPAALAARRNAAIGVLRGHGHAAIAAARRRPARAPHETLPLLGLHVAQ